jgi:acyl carrier protein
MRLEAVPLTTQISALIGEKLLTEIGSPGQDLLDTGVLDSLTLVQLLMDLEAHFAVTIPLEELEIDDFRTLASIAHLVQRRMAAVPAPPGPEAKNGMPSGAPDQRGRSAPSFTGVGGTARQS